jgi:hypothetical protein
MAKNKKPTNKDRDEAINTLMANTNWLKNQFELVGRLFDAYVLWKGDQDEFMKHIDQLRKEFADKQEEAKNETKEDAKPDAEPSEASPSNEG